MNEIAIVGLACKYPDADNHVQLWENILSRRRAFRKMPEKRLSSDYYSENTSNKDKIYQNKAAVLKNYVFDRTKYKISNSNFRIADLTHWLALDVATEALKNARLDNISAEDKTKTGVLVGNTLTGEFSRSNILRIRYPYIAKNVANQLQNEGWDADKIQVFLADLEKTYKSPFPEMEEDSLAGGLSNTIAGRICNYYDFKGGGYTIDGACSSSLLAVSNACNLIKDGDLDIALVGGVDLSLDPFELVGFSRAGALAKKEMLVYDEASNGFLPGEGCGFIVLTGLEYAQKNNLKVLGVIKGWGVSSDGQGGLTRPSVIGQTLAMDRAYSKAGYGIESVNYIEGHGTGTAVGDSVELSTISGMLEKINSPKKSLYVGSIKANIGHTKAAAGIAGLIKCILVLKNRMIPPATGFKKKHAIFTKNPLLRLPEKPVMLEHDGKVRASVSSMGFGGINTHITIESQCIEKDIDSETQFVSQNTELFLFSAKTKKVLFEKIAQTASILDKLSIAEFSDLSFDLYRNHDLNNTWKLAIVADSVESLSKKIAQLKFIENTQTNQFIDIENGVFLAAKPEKIRFGFLFPGQGNGFIEKENPLFGRFPFLSEQTNLSYIPASSQTISTQIAQPALVSTSILGLKILEKLNIKAEYGIGHSLGELSALHWSGAVSEDEVLRLASERGRLMHESVEVKGKMLSVSRTFTDEVTNILKQKYGVSLACINSEKQTVFSGTQSAIEQAEAYLKENQIACRMLNVENAFHSDLMKSISNDFAYVLSTLNLKKPEHKIVSTVTGSVETGLHHQNLIQQLYLPVKYYQAIQNTEHEVDYWVEIGKGNTLKGLTEDISEKPILSLDLGENITGILKLVALKFIFDSKFDSDSIFTNRFFRAFDWSQSATFIENQCEQIGKNITLIENNIITTPEIKETHTNTKKADVSIEQAFINRLSDKLDLPVELITLENRMLDDLHLNSLAVGQIIADFANDYELKITSVPLEYSNASIAEIVAMLNAHNDNKQESNTENPSVQGIRQWAFGFHLQKKESELATIEKNTSESSDWLLINKELKISTLRKEGYAESGILWDTIGIDETDLPAILVEFSKLFKANQSSTSVLVLVQNKPIFSGFIKSLFAEYPSKKVLIINTSADSLTPDVLDRELSNLTDFSEVFYENNQRKIELFSPCFLEEKIVFGLNQDDTILVTGGGKGITHECAKELALRYGVKLILTGRATIETDPILKQNLSNLEKLSVNFQYLSIDATSLNAVEKLILQLKAEETQITGIIHGAGINQPRPIARLTKEDIQNTYNVKVEGAINLFKVIEAFSPKFFISFGSIIAQIGMEGNADYAFANENLRSAIEQRKGSFPNTLCRIYEWSVWSGTGMGEHLNVLESLLKKGIYPITLDEGIKFFLKTFNRPSQSISLVVASRFANLKTVNLPTSSVPNLRFLEDVKLWFPEIEIIADATLSSVYDWYLNDHQVDRKLVLPAVVGLEAMAQLVTTLYTQPIQNINFKEVEFLHPIIIPHEGDTSIRIIVQRESQHTFSAVIRAKESSFQHDYFKAKIEVNTTLASGGAYPKFLKETQLKTKGDFYDNIVFHEGVFQKITDYYLVNPYECIAEGLANNRTNYFSDFLSSELIMSDFTLRDAVIHSVQTCVPDKILLPVGFDSLSIYDLSPREKVTIHAKELKKVGNVYHYDIMVYDEQHNLIEVFFNIRFKEYAANTAKYFATNLAKNIVQRKLDEELKQKNLVDIHFDSSDLKNHIMKRADGKPFISEGYCSKTTLETTEMLVMSNQPVACDLESVYQESSKSWNLLLNQEDYSLAKKSAENSNEDFNISATRIWGIRESLKKLGDSHFTPITHSTITPKEDFQFYASPNNTIMSGKCKLSKTENDVIITLIVKNNEIF
ncbi:MAG: SDR family NAD(P)-dependent oxidoreductase [Flavobacterium sp.]